MTLLLLTLVQDYLGFHLLFSMVPNRNVCHFFCAIICIILTNFI